MRITRRRARRPDPLASPSAVSVILERLREFSPRVIPKNEKLFIGLLRAVRHIERYSATDTRRGRHSRWDRADLLNVAAGLRQILDRETEGRVSLASFVDHYLRVLEFPADIIAALEKGTINLFEAEQLARLTPKCLDMSVAEARSRRAELLQSHLAIHGSGARLRARVREMLGELSEVPEPALQGITTAPGLEDLENLEDLSDPTILFYDEITRLILVLREIRPEDLTDELSEQFFQANDELWNVIARIQRRKQPKQSQQLKI
jgi:hypothetical protein